jgi:radical SAM superfamily enzyme YgiQ (UPF0313 family)
LRDLSVLLINPRFEPSFFGQEHLLRLLPGDKRCNVFNGALPLLAALAPEGCRVTIVDENIEDIDFSAAARYDVIGVTGMIVQRSRMDEILDALRGLEGVVCVGGPYATVDEGHFRNRCDVLFVGEADETWTEFLRAVANGESYATRYKQETPTDMSRLPAPRFDLVQAARYLSAPIQFSRGCPFLCEFCDIIVIFGRRPRLKSEAQVLAELDALLAQGVRFVFFVDDNFIGNKASAKAMLTALIEWQTRKGFPLTFTTEASINLGDEPELMDLLWRANFRSLFVGIESPRKNSLLETRKTQNVRGDSMANKLERLRDSGVIVQAGFIVGFDSDDEGVFDELFDFAQDNGIGISVVSILSPIPSTPLYDRLAREGRLFAGDPLVWFEPKLMTRATLKERYHELNRRLYSPEAFFCRVFRGYSRSAAFRARHRAGVARAAASPVVRLAGSMVMLTRLTRAVAGEGLLRAFGKAYLSAYFTQRRALGREALPLPDFVSLCIRHWHHYKIANDSQSFWGRAGNRGPDAAEPAPLVSPAE